jgi:uncharacterized lipoprotein YmbA
MSSIGGQAGEAVADGGPAMSIGILAVQLPGYLNRTQMMTRSGLHRMEIASLHRWVDYPDRMVQQVLGDNLQVLMPRAHVVNVPWPAGLKPDLTVSVHFLELIGTTDGQVLLGAIWRIAGPGRQAMAPSHRTRLAVPMSGRGFDALAAAHSRVLSDLCREIADTLGTMRSGEAGQHRPAS